ncbi:MAG: hypothetical protein LWW85_10270, partial [Marinilabiliales bacterium]|nr:hypothetical protein [Marinilabiliales bacterium]
MDGFSYHNIFATKGIEYLIVVVFAAILIPFWLALNKQVRENKKPQKRLRTLSAAALRIPQGIFFN